MIRAVRRARNKFSRAVKIGFGKGALYTISIFFRIQNKDFFQIQSD